MGYDDALANRVRLALRNVRPVQEQRMFGGLMFMVRGKVCVSVGKERLMCRIDPAIHDAVLERKGCQTVVMRGRQYRGYVHIDATVLRIKRQLDYWLGLALEYNDRWKGPVRISGQGINLTDRPQPIPGDTPDRAR